MTALTEERTGIVVPGTPIASQWMEVTAEQASEWLEKNTKNRHVRDRHLARLKKDMTNDKFVVTHQGVAICEDGTLIDGQHRLKAIVDTGKPQWLLVTTGLPMEAQQFVDNGARRQPADMGPLKEGGYGAMKAAAVKLLLSIEDLDHTISPRDISNAANDYTYGDLVAGYTRYEDLIEKHLDLARAAARDFKGRVGASQFLAAGVYYHESAAEFLSGVASGANLDSNDARLAIRRYQGPGRVQVPVASFVAFKAARYFHYNKSLSVIRYRFDEKMNLLKAPQDSKPWGGGKKTDGDA